MLGFGEKKSKKLSTESYKGVRDFYPEDQQIRNYIFKILSDVAEAWGYSEYSASVLEPSELYKSKTSDEIVNEQTYTFKDRGDREVTLRPEMTPTVARMIAHRISDLPLPARWYSIQNLFRYEKPQRGRVREHWQLNADIFGSESPYADAEVILLAISILKKMGATPNDYEIRINSRALMNELYEKVGISAKKSNILSRIIDKKGKISTDAFKEAIEKEVPENSSKFIELLESKDEIFEMLSSTSSGKNLSEIVSILEKIGVANLKFTPTLVRGFDYYTGMVFEVFDTNKENPRSLFGGGRYDDLLSEFTNRKVGAVGFGMGDVTIRDFMETHGLLPKLNSTTHLWLAVAPDTDISDVYKFADFLKEGGMSVGIDISLRKLGDQIVGAEKRGIPLIIAIGKNELESDSFTVRRLSDRVEKNANKNNLIAVIKELL